MSETGDVVGSYTQREYGCSLAKIKVVQFARILTGCRPIRQATIVRPSILELQLTGLNGTTIEGQNIEQSNTDIASEFSKMIVTQQAYSANTKVISTAQDMMSSLINIIR